MYSYLYDFEGPGAAELPTHEEDKEEGAGPLIVFA